MMRALLKFSADVLKFPLPWDRPSSNLRHPQANSWFKRASAILLAAVCAAWSAPAASAQVTFAGAQRTIASGGLSDPQAVEVDGSGNVFVADFGDSGA